MIVFYTEMYRKLRMYRNGIKIEHAAPSRKYFWKMFR